MYHERTKHIDVIYHFIKDIKVTKVKNISNAYNSANIMTKPVPSRMFEHCLQLHGDQSGEGNPFRAREDNEDPKDA